MKNKIRIGMGTALGLLLVLTAFSLVVLPEMVSARTWTVDSNGGGDFTTISAAVLASTTGDVINVMPGSGYSENVNVNVAVTIIGMGGRPCVTPQSQNSPVFYVTSTGVTIENLEIDGQNMAGVDGVKSVATAGEGNSVYLKNLVIHRCNYGVWIGPLSGTYPTHNYVVNSTIYENSMDGVKIISHPDPGSESQRGYHYVRECSIYNNGLNGVNIYGDYNAIRNPDFYNNLRGVLIDGDENSLTGVTEIDGSGHHIFNNDREGVRAIGDGLLIESGSEDLIISSNGDNGYDGIYHDGDDSLIQECNISGNGGNGLYLNSCNNCDIHHIEIYHNSGHGVYFNNSDDNDLIDLDCNGDTYGMYFNLSDDNDMDNCDYYNLDIAIKSVGSQRNDFFGVNNQGSTYYSDIINCDEAINATYSGSINSTGRIKNYDIDNGTGIYIEGISWNNPSWFKWNTIPNESNLSKKLVFGYWWPGVF